MSRTIERPRVSLVRGLRQLDRRRQRRTAQALARTPQQHRELGASLRN
jgi:hypothetical protein